MTGDLKCPYCLWPMKAEEQIETCPHCSARYHLECWTENQGCGTFGCPAWAAGQTGTAPPPPPPSTPGGTPSGSAPVVIEADPLPAVGAPARRFCDMCGQSINPGERFCGSCGNTL